MSDYWKAFLVGAALFVVLVPFNNPHVSEGLLVFVDAGAFGVAGAAAGFVWPRRGWRLGPPLVAFWFLMALCGILLALDAVNWEAGGDLRGLLLHAMIVVAACLGAEVGAIVGRRQGRRTAAVKD